MKNLLIVGGTGFIGYHLLKEAQKRKYKVTSISLNRPKKLRYLKGVKYILADISNYKILKKNLILALILLLTQVDMESILDLVKRAIV